MALDQFAAEMGDTKDLMLCCTFNDMKPLLTPQISGTRYFMINPICLPRKPPGPPHTNGQLRHGYSSLRHLKNRDVVFSGLGRDGILDGQNGGMNAFFGINEYRDMERLCYYRGFTMACYDKYRTFRVREMLKARLRIY